MNWRNAPIAPQMDPGAGGVAICAAPDLLASALDVVTRQFPWRRSARPRLPNVILFDTREAQNHDRDVGLQARRSDQPYT